jgi:hypothetical protein
MKHFYSTIYCRWIYKAVNIDWLVTVSFGADWLVIRQYQHIKQL